MISYIYIHDLLAVSFEGCWGGTSSTVCIYIYFIYIYMFLFCYTMSFFWRHTPSVPRYLKIETTSQKKKH